MVDFNIRVIVDPSGARRGSRGVRNELEGINRAAERTRRLLTQAFAFVGLGVGIGGTIRILADFEQALSTVRGITGATEEQFQAFREEAARLGATTRFSATDAANGLLFLSRAGFEVAESLEAIGPTLTLAQAGALGLSRAADIASNVLQGFRLATDETTRVVDVLALAANSANTSVAQLGEAMSFVAPVAAGLGVEIEEAAAAVGVLSDAGVQASRAGTGLSRVLAELESPSNRSREILAELGVTADEVRISQVGLTSAVSRLAQAGLDTGRALEIFGQRGGPAFEIISSGIPNVARLTEEFQNAEGSAENLARIMDDNLNGALLAVRSAVEAVILAVGEGGATSALTALFRSIASGLRDVAANIDVFIRGAEAVAIVIGVAIARRAIPAAIAALGSLTVALLANPFTAILTALTATSAVLIAFADRISVSSDGLSTLADVGTVAFARLEGAADALATTFVEAFGTATDSVASTVGEIDSSLEGVLRTLAGFLDTARSNFILLNRDVGEVFGLLGAFIVDVFRRTINGVIEIVENGVDAISGALNIVIEGVGLQGFEAIDLGRIETQTDDIARRTADALRRAVAEANAEAPFTEAVDAFFAEVGQTAAARIAASAQEATSAAEAAATNVQAVATTVATARAAVPESEFARLVRQLQEENDLLVLNSREREIRQGLLAAERELDRQLTDVESERVEGLLRTNQALNDQATTLDAIEAPVANYERGLEALQALLDQGRISTEEFADAQRELRLTLLDTATDLESGFERGFLRIEEQFNDLATLAERTLVGAFQEAEDALVDFVVTGQGSFTDLVNSIQEDLARLAVRQAITGPLANLVGGLGAGGGGGAGILGSLFGGGGAGGGGFGLGGLFGFQNGGSFTVGGRPGIDQNILSLNGAPVGRVSRNERIDITPAGQGGIRPLTVNFNFPPGTDADSFRRSEGQIAARTQLALRSADRRNN